MSRMSELNLLVQELKKCGESLVNIADELAEIFSETGEKKAELPAEQEKEEEKPVETVISQPVGDIFAAQSEQTNDKDIGEAKVIPNGPVEEEEDSEQKKKAKSRNRVGSMFDLLTFGDV